MYAPLFRILEAVVAGVTEFAPSRWMKSKSNRPASLVSVLLGIHEGGWQYEDQKSHDWCWDRLGRFRVGLVAHPVVAPACSSLRRVRGGNSERRGHQCIPGKMVTSLSTAMRFEVSRATSAPGNKYRGQNNRLISGMGHPGGPTWQHWSRREGNISAWIRDSKKSDGET